MISHQDHQANPWVFCILMFFSIFYKMIKSHWWSVWWFFFVGSFLFCCWLLVIACWVRPGAPWSPSSPWRITCTWPTSAPPTSWPRRCGRPCRPTIPWGGCCRSSPLDPSLWTCKSLGNEMINLGLWDPKVWRRYRSKKHEEDVWIWRCLSRYPLDVAMFGEVEEGIMPVTHESTNAVSQLMSRFSDESQSKENMTEHHKASLVGDCFFIRG